MNADHGPGALGQLLPRNEIRVMLHQAEHDLIPAANVGVAPASRDKIDSLGRAMREDHLLAARRIDESANRFPGLLVEIGRFVA